MPRVVLAFDKFRGTATASELVAAGEHSAHGCGWSVSPAALADGGEGSLEALGGPNRHTEVYGPQGQPVSAGWRLVGETAFIEMAQASGLDLVGGAANNDPLASDTFGTGQLITKAMDLGATTIVVFLGGSATTDGGWGALRAMPSKAALKQVELIVAADVTTSFIDAAVVFGPQKGATSSQVRMLTRRLERLAQVYLADFDVDVTTIAGAGAAGGLAGGLVAVGATIRPGFDVIADAVELDALCAAADLVVTGEGYLDRESFSGKVVGGVTQWATNDGVDTLAIVGDHEPGLDLPDRLEVVSLVERYGREAAFANTAELVAEVVREALSARSGASPA